MNFPSSENAFEQILKQLRSLSSLERESLIAAMERDELLPHKGEVQDSGAEAEVVGREWTTQAGPHHSTHRLAQKVRCVHCQAEVILDPGKRKSLSHCPVCGHVWTKQAPFELQETVASEASLKIGKFEVISLLGEGGFGSVYKARDVELDRLVAVKVPRRAPFGGTTQDDRFIREARSAAQLSHPSIVPVFEVGNAMGAPYIISEYVEGITLADALTARRFGIRAACELVAAVADALDYSHQRGVVHRDVKPSNIMLDKHGAPRLMDFGLARRDSDDETMTVEGQLLGTVQYMSPEQAQGDSHHVDGRGDVYSLGVVLYQLITGELPFRGNQRMLLHQVMHEDPRPPRALNDHIPMDLQTICLKAMEKGVLARYQSARGMAEDLRSFLLGRPISARPLSSFGQAWRWYCRNTDALVATAGVYCILISLIKSIWEAMGFFFLAFGFAPASPRILVELALQAALTNPLTLMIGVATIRKKGWAILTGSAVALLWTVITFIALFRIQTPLPRLEVMYGGSGDLYLHSQFYTLVFLLSLIGLVLYCLAIFSYVRDHRRSSEKKTSIGLG